MFSIRRYQPTDKEIVKALYYAGLEQFDADLRIDGYLSLDKDLDNIENVYINNGGDFLVGVLDGEFVAMGALRKLSNTKGEIKRMAVRRDQQRQGYGQAIFTRLLQIAVELGYQELCLDTTAQNLPAQRLYEKLGFVEVRRFQIGRLKVVFYNKRVN